MSEQNVQGDAPAMSEHILQGESNGEPATPYQLNRNVSWPMRPPGS
jgi:hypothetical protein